MVSFLPGAHQAFSESAHVPEYRGKAARNENFLLGFPAVVIGSSRRATR